MDAAPWARSGDLRPAQYFFNCRTGGWREDPADGENRGLARGPGPPTAAVRPKLKISTQISDSPSERPCLSRQMTAAPDRLVCHPSGMKNDLSFVSRSGGVAIAQPPANFCYPSGIKTKDGCRTVGEVGRPAPSAVFF
jgi:hypothetical protein